MILEIRDLINDSMKYGGGQHIKVDPVALGIAIEIYCKKYAGNEVRKAIEFIIEENQLPLIPSLELKKYFR